MFFHRSQCSNVFGETRAIAALPGEAGRKYLPTEGSDSKCLPPEEWLTSPISAIALQHSAHCWGAVWGAEVEDVGLRYDKLPSYHDDLLSRPIPKDYCSNK